ncbi:MAG: JAB domain-containing protein [Candidatus Hodarchaeaceae archaeon]|nr:JAB domain-containing protein [Candidatus Hodarchaeaceae archaeon]
MTPHDGETSVEAGMRTLRMQMSSRGVGTCPTQASEVQGARSELVGGDAVIGYWKGGAVGGLGKRALKLSALEASFVFINRSHPKPRRENGIREQENFYHESKRCFRVGRAGSSGPYARGGQAHLPRFPKRADQLRDDIRRGVDITLLRPREVFASAFKNSATFIILVHNHPSGSPEPSETDIEVTKKLVKIGKMLGVWIQDHVIIGSDGYTSMKAHGIISNKLIQ